MTAQTDRGEMAQPTPRLNRRCVAGGLAAFAALGAASAFAQTPPPATGARLPTAEEEATVLANLFTRMSTKTSINGRVGFEDRKSVV